MPLMLRRRRSGVGGSQKDLALPTGPCAPRQLLRAPLTDSPTFSTGMPSDVVRRGCRRKMRISRSESERRWMRSLHLYLTYLSVVSLKY
jgi:hypothetical protein